MNVKFQKQSINYELASFDEFRLDEDLEFCCYRLRIMNSKTPLWDKKSGRFCWTDMLSGDDVVYYPIDFCPFCGERFEYIEVKN